MNTHTYQLQFDIDKKDPNKPVYYVSSPIALSKFQMQKILKDYKAAHQFDHFVEYPIEIPFPPELLDRPE